MAEFLPTPAQDEAVNNRGGALLVSANAGSGKTRVLTERLISCVTAEDADIDEFLVITYTRAAAAELKSRIGDALADEMAKDPASRRLRRQSVLLARAPIGTIHSFCATLLREKCQLAGLSPDFVIAEQDRIEKLRAMSLRKAMDAAYERPEPDFLHLADTVGAGRDDSRLAELVLTLFDKIQCHARPAMWIEAQLAALEAPAGRVEDTVWGRSLMEDAAREAAYIAAELRDILALISAPELDYILKAYGPSMAESAASAEAFAGALARGWDAASACEIVFPRLGSLRLPPDPELVEQIKTRREAVKDAAKKLMALFSESADKLLADQAKTAPAMRSLLRLVSDFDRRFTAEKRRRSLVDYGDLEHLAAQLLADEEGAPTETAREISGRYREIMVDEYQDVSAVQELIIRALSRNDENLFMVGDVKQSIYRFRLADPTIFIQKFLSFRNAAEAAPGQPRRVLLRENFRSQPAILEAANAVFGALMSESLGELDYDGDSMLIPGRVTASPGVTPELIAVTRPGDSAADEERPDKTALEAAVVAAKIRTLVDSGELIEDGGQWRPVGYGDIAILLRSANRSGGIYARELSKRGIPVQAGVGGFFEAPEIAVLRSLLTVIDNPRQDIPLIAVLSSPLFGFAPDALAAVRAFDPDADFIDALTLAAESDEKSAAFLQKLGLLRRLAPDMETGVFVRRVYTELDVLALAAASERGEERRARLMALFELACRFAQSGYAGLRAFILWLDAMAERGEEPALGRGADGGHVRIMSIHRSKGLEFPVVFLSDTARRFNKMDSRAGVLVHPELGLGPKVTDTARGIEYPGLARHAIARRLEREGLSEELRLLYVAMTRARERLFITCVLPDPEKAIAETSAGIGKGDKIAPERLAKLSAPCLWLFAAAAADGGEHLRVRIHDEDGAAGLETVTRTEETPPDEPAEVAPEEVGALAGALDWVYPYDSVGLPSKLSATELKGFYEADPESKSLAPELRREFRKPVLGRAAEGLSAADRGTATHLLLRHIDFSKTGDAAAVEGELSRLVSAGLMSEAEAGAVDTKSVLRFFESDTGRRILGAARVVREFPFTLLVPAAEFFSGGGEDELLLQGVVDCCIEEDGALTVIDYKTDRITAAEAPDRAEAYAGQLAAYAHAMARIFGKPVRECVLYFLRPGVAVSRNF